ncbi:TetR/AcrR family transcriptional regulator [Flavobacteriaceae bacterium F08102]|nr:TetR/AcrR family transcriptional regulator [Flavobacteriaceae bacterium F08102]
MDKKNDILKCSIENFTQFGSKSFTLQDLSEQMGISKKTIYHYFNSKEDLVTQSVTTLLENYQKDIDSIIKSCSDPIECVILIYKRGFEIISNFKPSFLYGLKKYYPKANNVFENFRTHLTYTITYNLLIKAQQQGIIRPKIDVHLVCTLHFTRIDTMVFKNDNLFDTYSIQTILYYLINCNLKGLVCDGYHSALLDDTCTKK